MKILNAIPQTVALACSGGPDSMAALDFLRLHGKRTVYVVYFNHGTEHGQEAERFLRSYCQEHNLPLFVGGLLRERKKDESPEEFWRNERYRFFNDVMNGIGTPLITCHHLDDQVENWFLTATHGAPKLIPYQRGYVIRPFLLTRKKELLDWCERKGVPFVVDPSNKDPKYCRNRIRMSIIPEIEKINPGIYKTISRMVVDAYEVR